MGTPEARAVRQSVAYCRKTFGGIEKVRNLYVDVSPSNIGFSKLRDRPDHFLASQSFIASVRDGL